MAEKCFLKPNDSLVFDYVNQISTICTVLIDQQMVMCDCNLAFQVIIGANSKPVGEDFFTYLVTKDQTLQINPPEKGFQRISFTLSSQDNTQNDMVGYVARATEGYLLFCERSWISEDKIFEEISKINNQLANMTRELNKKNVALEKANTAINKLLLSYVQ